MATGMNSIHLAAGSTFPPLAGGKLRLYNMRFCPFGERTLLTVLHKELPIEIVNMDLLKKAEWMQSKNPIMKVPILEINDKIVYDSAICNEWLDRMFPNSKQLLPKDPTAAAHQKIIAERTSGGLMTFYGVMRVSEADRPAKVAALKKVLEECNTLLTADFYGGSEVAYADFMIWPLLERLGCIDAMYKEVNIVKHLNETYPKLAAYIERMMKVPAVAAAAVSIPIHVEFLAGYASCNAQFDALCAKLA